MRALLVLTLASTLTLPAQWTSEPPFAADATTYLYQLNTTPWQEGRLRVNPQTKLLEIGRGKQALPYAKAVELAERAAKSDSRAFRDGVPFVPAGTTIGQGE